MFSIYDGRKKFYQWDIDRKLIVNDKTISEVHFANCLCSDARKCTPYSIGELLVVDVPNELLTENMDVYVWGYDSGMTKHCVVFDVEKRTKPADYIYTPEEMTTWEQLAEQIALLTKRVEVLEDKLHEITITLNGDTIAFKAPSGITWRDVAAQRLLEEKCPQCRKEYNAVIILGHSVYIKFCPDCYGETTMFRLVEVPSGNPVKADDEVIEGGTYGIATSETV